MTKLFVDCQYLRPQASSESPTDQIPRYSHPVSSSSLKGPLVWEGQDVSCDSGRGTLMEKLSCSSPKARAAVYPSGIEFHRGFGHELPVLLWGPILRKALQSLVSPKEQQKREEQKTFCAAAPTMRPHPFPRCGNAAAGIPSGWTKGAGKAKIAVKQSRAAGAQEVLDCTGWGNGQDWQAVSGRSKGKKVTIWECVWWDACGHSLVWEKCSFGQRNEVTEKIFFQSQQEAGTWGNINQNINVAAVHDNLIQIITSLLNLSW